MQTFIRVAVSAPLDPGFQPAVLFNRTYAAAVKKSGQGVLSVISKRDGFVFWITDGGRGT